MFNFLKQRGIHCGHLNVCHIINKLDELKELIRNFDIFGFSETHLNASVNDEYISIPGFHAPFCKDGCSNSSSGTLLYVRDTLNCIRRNNLEHPDIESIWLEIKLKNTTLIFLCCVYRNPASRCNWLENFKQMIELPWNSGSEIIMFGDLNIDILNHNNCYWLDVLDLYNLKQIITSPTRVTSHSSTLFDYVIVSSPNNIIETSVPSYSISDHYPTCFTWNKKGIKIPKTNHIYITYRSFKYFSEPDYINDLQLAPFDNVYSTNDPNKALELWYNTIIPVINKHAPQKTKRVRNATKQPWLKEIFNMMRQRDYHKKKGNITQV
ncbi:uncharacterized protein LOC126810913 [Patella vulgata]|uniref:uncharacterized protein LOC126810913 n=1 Tax=Patella vulgata TaxID=6465 RepID=UPI00217F2C1D|nr:uncharacterized protein LOC126810913 [Patella vulgata]XP_050392239.1 uncharacterized protein LOC126810913 [Patella vulgata]XP_050392240.1 uncharacterized protein LOC126810913 [Patella vulgata]XP_050392241.1 uncharacterized protein LOC126810913 [Patella vulgata]XP_050392242.1 uncharacterized protein LOC126810913 [Patella vulgata]